MVVPLFGWSAGDIVVSIKILVAVASAFKEAKGAKSQFAESSTWLSTFASDLERIHDYTAENPDARYTANIIGLIGNIDKHYAEFERYLQKYNESLSSNASPNLIAGCVKKIKWSFKELQGRVQSLKVAVTAPIVSINMLLALQHCENLSTATQALTTLSTSPQVPEFEAAFHDLSVHFDALAQAHQRYQTDVSSIVNTVQDKITASASDTCDSIVQAQLESQSQIISHVEAISVDITATLSELQDIFQNIIARETAARHQASLEALEVMVSKIEALERALADSHHQLSESIHQAQAARSEPTLLEKVQLIGSAATIVLGLANMAISIKKNPSNMERSTDDLPTLSQFDHSPNSPYQHSCPTYNTKYHRPDANNGYHQAAYELQSSTVEEGKSKRLFTTRYYRCSKNPYSFETGDIYKLENIYNLLPKCVDTIDRPHVFGYIGVHPRALFMLRYLNPKGRMKRWERQWQELNLPTKIDSDVLAVDIHLYLRQIVKLDRHTPNIYLRFKASSSLNKEMYSNLIEDSKRWRAVKRDTNEELHYIDSDIFKARWYPLRQNINEYLDSLNSQDSRPPELEEDLDSLDSQDSRSLELEVNGGYKPAMPREGADLNRAWLSEYSSLSNVRWTNSGRGSIVNPANASASASQNLPKDRDDNDEDGASEENGGNNYTFQPPPGANSGSSQQRHYGPDQGSSGFKGPVKSKLRDFEMVNDDD